MRSKITIDFLGIGAERSATTWLADCLREHPQIYLPKQKELYFFNEYDPHFLKFKNLKYKRGISWYKGFFRDASAGSVKGEYSPTYLYSRLTAERIKKNFPNIKIIVSLRKPTERAFSQYLHDKHIGVISNKLSFEQVLETYPNYIEKGFYAKYLAYFYALFPWKNIFIIDYQKIEKEPEKVIRDLYAFLGVDKNFSPTKLHTRVYTAVSAKWQPLNYLLLHAEYLLRGKHFNLLLRGLEVTGVRKLAFTVNNYINVKPLDSYPTMKKETKMYLDKIFLGNISKLEKLAKMDLSSWR